MKTFTTIILKNSEEWKEAVLPLEKQLNYKVTGQLDEQLFYRGLIIQNDEGAITAACVVFVNEKIELDGQKSMCFGKILCINDQDSFNELVRLIRHVVKDRGNGNIIGPMDGSTWNNYRIGAENVRYKYFLDLMHPDYYIQLFENAQLKVLKKYFTFLDENIMEPVRTTLELKAKYDAKGIQIRPIDLNNFDDELNKLYTLCNTAFADNFLFTPISLEEFKSKYLPLKPYIDPRFVLVAVNVLGEFVGVIFAIHDHLNKEKKGMIVKTVARYPSQESRGLGKYLSALITLECLKLKYDYLLHAFMEESNDSSIDLSTLFNGRKVKEYHLYQL